jgi:hypothetical protein
MLLPLLLLLLPFLLSRAGGFCLKGINQVVDVVLVMPVGLEQRLLHLLPAASCNKVRMPQLCEF